MGFRTVYRGDHASIFLLDTFQTKGDELTSIMSYLFFSRVHGRHVLSSVSLSASNAASCLSICAEHTPIVVLYSRLLQLLRDMTVHTPTTHGIMRRFCLLLRITASFSLT